jgi:bacteriocin-like protein
MKDPKKSPPPSGGKETPPRPAPDAKKDKHELSDEDLDQVSGGLRSIGSRAGIDDDDDFRP